MTPPDEANVPLEDLLVHEGFLVALARRLTGDPEEADDLVQETWLAYLQRRTSITSPRAWLEGVVRHRWSTRKADEQARKRREHKVARPEAVDSSEAQRGLENRARVLAAVRTLPEPYLMTIYLRYYEQLSIAQVAARMGVPKETARSRIQRGIELLRAKLDREFGDRGSWLILVAPWARSAEIAGPALPSIPLAAALGSPLAWLLAIATSAAVLLLALFAGLWTRGGSDAPALPDGAGAGGAARAVVSTTPAGGGAPRTPAQEPALSEPVAAADDASGEAAEIDAAASQTFLATHQSSTFRLHGRVLKADGQPAAGAQIACMRYRSVSDAAGRFELVITIIRYQRRDGVQEVFMPLIASLEGHLPAVVPDVSTLLSDDPAAIQPLELVLGEAPRTLTGRVVTEDGRPAEDWRVNLRDHSLGLLLDVPQHLIQGVHRHLSLEVLAAGQAPVQVADAEGRFELEGLLDRPYDVLAWHPRSLLHVVTEAVHSSDSPIVITVPDHSIAGRVAGRVVSRTGAPLPNVEVHGLLVVVRVDTDIYDPEHAAGPLAISDLQGYFEFPPGVLGAVRLMVDSKEFLLHDVQVDLEPLEDLEQVEVVLPVTCQVVLDARSAQPPSDLLSFLDENGQWLSIRVSEEELAAMGFVFDRRILRLTPGVGERVITTTDDAVIALFHDVDGTEIERRPIQLTRGVPTILTW